MEREESGDSCACKCLRIPGFCFTPSDEILVGYYLREKVEGRPLACNPYVAELKIYDDHLLPWEILKDDDHHWITSSSSNSSSNKITKTMYVFTDLCKKKTRVTKRSGCGSWTGQYTRVVENVAGDKIGYKKLLTFYRDNDDKLKMKKKIIDEDHGHWNMHEYSLLGIDNYVICKISNEVEMSSRASTDQAVPAKQDVYSHRQHLLSRKEVVLPVPDVIPKDTNPRRDVKNMNMLLGDDKLLGGSDHDDQPLDESGTDWDKNGWKVELEKELGLDISDDKSDDQCLDDYGEVSDWDMNGRTTELCKLFDDAENLDQNEILDDKSADIVQKLPILSGMNEPQQVQSVLNFYGEEEAVAAVQELPIIVLDKNEKTNESFIALDGVGYYDVIEISDDDSLQQLPMIGAVDDPPKTLPINFDDQSENNRASNNNPDDLSDFLNHIAEMDGNVAVQESPFVPWEDLEQISNDFANFEQLEATLAVEPTNTTLDGFDVILEFTSDDIMNLGGAETNQQNFNIFEEQPRKRTRADVDYFQKFSSQKKQRYLQI